MPNLRDVKLSEYAAAQRRHIAIIGKFTKDTRCETVPYSDAVRHLQRKLYAVPQDMMINDERWFAQKLVTANDLSDEEARTAVEVQFDGVLGKELASGKSGSEVIGGKLFGVLLSALDDLMPFTHPSFDMLLIETFVEFTQASRGTNTYVSDTVRKLIGAPEVRERFLAYLRSDPTRRKKYLASFRNAAREKARELGMAEPGEICDRICDRASDFVGELNAESTESRKTLHEIDDNRNRYKELRERIRQDCPPKHQPETTTPIDAHLHHLFVEFHRARADVEGIVNCEPILTLMVCWLFTKFGAGQKAGNASRKIWKKFYRDAVPMVSEETRGAIHDEFKKSLESLKGELSRKETDAEERFTIQAMTELLADHAIEEHRKAYLRKNVFSASHLMDAIVRMQDRLMLTDVPGMTAARAEIKKKIDEMRESFSEYAKRRAEEDLTVKDLLAMYEGLRKNDPTLAKCMEELLEGAGGRTGSELTVWFERELGAVEGKATADSIKKLIEEKRDEAGEHLVSARRLYRDGLRKVYAGGDGHDGVAQAPPGGSVNREAVRHAPEGDEHQEDRSRNQDQSSTVSDTRRAVLGARGDASGMEANTDKRDESLGKFPEASTNSEVSGSGDGEEGQTDAEEDGVIGTEEELRTPKQREKAAGWIDDLRTRLIEKLVTSTELGEERARCRSVLLGETVLAADPLSSPLNRPDRSLLVHFILRMVEKLGAGQNADRERLISPQEIDWGKNGPDKEFLDLPFPEMVEPRSDDEGDIGWLSRFVEGWRNSADDIVETVPQAIAEFKEVRTLVEELAGSRMDGNVTIINDTLEGHCARTPVNENMLISKRCVSNKDPGCIPPPGIVYVSRLAFSNEARTLRGVYGALFNDENGPLAYPRPGENAPTVIQGANDPFADGCTWGMPIFIGHNLVDENENLPTISVDAERVSLAPGVLWLAGVDSRLLAETVESSLRRFVADRVDRVGENETTLTAWNNLLTTDEAIAAQVRSRICSLAMLARVRNPNENPNFRTILEHTMQDLGRTQDALESALQELQDGERIRVGADNTPLPPSIRTLRGRDAEANLAIGDRQVAALFPRL